MWDWRRPGWSRRPLLELSRSLAVATPQVRISRRARVLRRTTRSRAGPQRPPPPAALALPPPAALAPPPLAALAPPPLGARTRRARADRRRARTTPRRRGPAARAPRLGLPVSWVPAGSRSTATS